MRKERGRELEVWNAEQLVGPVNALTSNFGFAGDKLVILAGDQVAIFQLGQNVTKATWRDKNNQLLRNE